MPHQLIQTSPQPAQRLSLLIGESLAAGNSIQRRHYVTTLPSSEILPTPLLFIVLIVAMPAEVRRSAWQNLRVQCYRSVQVCRC